MACLLNTFGRISNLDNIIQFLEKKETTLPISDPGAHKPHDGE